ncbi:alpha-N-acetylglucosaminidase [Fopius arisanus]|uniref:Alpha-N-acetylglucosaminidase n=1 Tax=Fopius arisanus TaxID=64838 RepID=A0A9R1TC74_9HYME|nr:PREDICTED: alpha-N-acetylglucosaminidase [Fopius arisanus]
MKELIILYFVLSILTSSSAWRSDKNDFQKTLGHLKPQTPPEVQAKAAEDLISRIIGNNSKLFTVSINPEIGPEGRDTFKIVKNQLGIIEITANTGVSGAWGFHYYLRHYCNAHIAWEGMQVELPNTLPEVNVTVVSNDRFRYYQNVCTAGYSSVWWSWSQWESNIDWMALNGINLALAFHGQEAIWQRIYLQLNMTREEVDDHFGGPAFLPWTRMGNIRGWGGPLPESWHEHSISIQHKILDRMRQLGIIPILPTFAGYVPRAFSRIFPSGNMTKIGTWNDFEDKYCCPMLLEPTDPLFNFIGQKFLRAYIEEFGTDHVYSGDTFNENEPLNTELESLRNSARAVFSIMTEVDEQAIWIMQGWLFVHDIEFWTEPRVEAFVTAVPIGKMIVLDLQSEQFPQYSRLKSYYGQPFIWCMLQNFGGTLGMFGSATIINKRISDARNMKGSTMVGTGLTPEGINQNYIIFELMNEMAYRRRPVDLNAWFENYATRRYGAWNEYATESWRLLGSSVYNFVGIEKIRGHYVLTRRPSLKITPWSWYDPQAVWSAWETFLKARYGRINSTLYKYDLVDLTRQVIQLKIDDVYVDLVNAYSMKNLTSFRELSHYFLELFDDAEDILSTSEHFLLGKWIGDARSLGTTEVERQLYEYNARNQITLWGPNGEIRDYANKQWSGVVLDYFKPRWVIFVEALDDSLAHGKKFNSTLINQRMFDEVEKPFTFARKYYSRESKGDAISVALSLNEKWSKLEGAQPEKRRRNIKLRKFVN